MNKKGIMATRLLFAVIAVTSNVILISSNTVKKSTDTSIKLNFVSVAKSTAYFIKERKSFIKANIETEKCFMNWYNNIENKNNSIVTSSLMNKGFSNEEEAGRCFDLNTDHFDLVNSYVEISNDNVTVYLVANKDGSYKSIKNSDKTETEKATYKNKFVHTKDGIYDTDNIDMASVWVGNKNGKSVLVPVGVGE